MYSKYIRGKMKCITFDCIEFNYFDISKKKINYFRKYI